jgi:hypothetical protein
MWEVLETAKRVTEKSRRVRINQNALLAFSQNIREAGMQVPPWNYHCHFFDGSEETVSYLLVLDTLNFCFWSTPGEHKWEVESETQEGLSGYYALAVALKKAIKSGIPITNAHYLAELSLDELKQLLDGTGKLQLLRNRLRSLNELGNVLRYDYGGQAFRLVEAAEKSAVALSRLLAEKLPSFHDTAEYCGQKVFFYKRAQIFVADLFGAFEGKAWGSFGDMDQLTAFADYKLPQVLRHLGILHYEKALAQKVDHQEYLDAGSPEEVEIRANTVWTVELIRRELVRAGHKLRAFEIDWILWNLGQEETFKLKPYHRTVTVFY